MSLAGLGAFNLLVLVSPPRFIAGILELVDLPNIARWTFFGAVLFNVLASMAFERWAVPVVAGIVGELLHRRRRRTRDGKAYRALSGSEAR